MHREQGFTHVVAIERAGRAADGHYYTMRAFDMTHIVAPIDDLFLTARTCASVSVSVSVGRVCVCMCVGRASVNMCACAMYSPNRTRAFFQTSLMCPQLGLEMEATSLGLGKCGLL